MPIMKYTPQFVERQYVPMNNLGIIDSVLGQRQKEYDAATMLQNQAVSELYGLQTTQGFQPKRDELIKGIESQITQAAEKRGGDYGAALQDIMGIVSKAKADPFFQRNRQVLEEAEMLKRIRANNPNIHVIRDPNTLAYNPDASAEDLTYKVLDPQELIKLQDQLYAERARKVHPLEAASHPTFGTIARQRIGMTDQEIATEATPETVNKLLATMGYGDLQQTNPELFNTIASNVYDRFKTYNQGYRDTPWGGSKTNQESPDKVPFGGASVLPNSGMMLVPESLNDLGSRTFSKIGNSLAVDEAKRLGLEGISSYADLEKAAEGSIEYNKRTMPMISPEGVYQASPNLEKPSKGDLVSRRKAKEALDNIERKLKGGLGTGLPMYEVNRLATTNPTEFEKINKIQSQLNNVVFEKRNSIFDPFSSKDKDALESMVDKGFNVTNVVPNFKEDEAGVILIVSGVDKNDKEQIARVRLKPNQLHEEQNLVGYLGRLNPIIAEEYIYAKQSGKEGKMIYLENLYQAASQADPQTKQVIGKFIQAKLQELNN